MDQQARDLYQRRATSRIDGLLRQGCDSMLSAPTGSGKTLMTLMIARGEREREGRVVVAQGSVGLAKQNAARAAQEGFDPVVWAEGKRPRGGEIVYGVVNTMVDRVAELGPVSLLVVDEGHHASDKEGGTYKRFIDQVVAENPDVRLLMTSATPERPDGVRLHPRIAAAEAVTVTWREVIDAGMMMLPETHQGTIRLSDGTTVQDAARALIDPANPSKSAVGLNAVARDRRPDDLVDQWVGEYLRRPQVAAEKTLFFMDLTEDADRVAAALRERGLSFEAIHSKMNPRDVERHVEDYKNGTLHGLASVGMIGEGFDAPRTGAVVNCKFTTSPVEYIQMVGRESRAADGKERCHYLDLGASVLMHGRFDVLSAVEDHVNGTPSRADRSNPNRWRAWTPCGRDTVGIDLGNRALFARRLDDERFLVTTTLTDRAGSTQMAKVGVMAPAEVKAIGRAAITECRKTVVTLCSDIDGEGRTQMARRLRALVARHGASLEVIAKAEAARPAKAPAAAVVASAALSRRSSASLGR